MIENQYVSPDEQITLRFFSAFLKRWLDIVAGAAGLIVLSPLFIAVGVIIKLTSPGPVFYRGVRTGRHGVPFRIFKFRTMVPDAEKTGGPTTGTNDTRVTHLGWLLRRTKIDELPQLINLLTGDMSLVGPRPEVPLYTAQYKNEEKIILSVRPGITDLSSIQFIDLDNHVGQKDPDLYFRENILPTKNALRVRYVREQSLHGDLVLLLKTAAHLARHIANKSSWK